MKKVLLGFIAMPLLAAQIASADLVPFSLTSGGTVSGPSYTKTQSISSGGVSFDATLSVFGSGSIAQNGDGLGVIGNGPMSVSNGEALFFSMSVSNVTGGDVFFDGFTAVDFNLFGATDTGVLSLDFSSATTADNFFTSTSGGDVVDITSTSPQTFFAIAAPITTGDPGNDFRIGSVTGSFSVLGIAAVPEPTAFLFGSLVAGTVGMVAARRRPTRKPAITD